MTDTAIETWSTDVVRSSSPGFVLGLDAEYNPVLAPVGAADGLASTGQLEGGIAAARDALNEAVAAAKRELLANIAAANAAIAAETDRATALFIEANELFASKLEIVSQSFGPTTDASDVADFLSAVQTGKNVRAARSAGAVALAAIAVTEGTLVDTNRALASVTETIGVQFGEQAAFIQDQATAQATVNDATAATLHTIQTTTDTTSAAVTALAAATSTRDSSIAIKTDTIAAVRGADVDTSDVADFVGAVNGAKLTRANARAAAISLAGVQTNAAAITDATQAMAQLSSTVAARFGDAFGAITNESNARATAGGALAGRVDTTAAASGAGDDYSAVNDFLNAVAAGQRAYANAQTTAIALAGVQQVTLAQANANLSLAAYTTTVAAQFGSVQASVTIQAAALATAQSSIASLDTTVAAQGASISSNTTAIGSAQSSIASLNTTVATQGASVTSNTTAIGNAQSSIASLTTTVATQGASVTSNATAITTINGQLAASFSLAVDVSGYITSIQLLNGGAAGSALAFRADLLTLVMPGYSAKPVLTASTVNGVPTLAFNGNIVADGSLLNAGIGANAVTNGSSSTGRTAGNSGTASLTVRSGSRVVITATYSGGTPVTGSTSYRAGQVDVTYTPPGGSAVTKTFIIPNFWNSSTSVIINMTCTGVIAIAGATGGTWSASAHSYMPAVGDFNDFDTTIVIQEFSR